MKFPDVIYAGPAIDDQALLTELPPALAALLRARNGLVAYRGGLHLRGACTQPSWHSLRAAWRGPTSFAARYPAAVQPGDVPLMQQVLGDQFLLRDGLVMRLRAEIGEIVPLGVDLDGFFQHVRVNPVAALGLEALLQFEGDGETLQPGQLLSTFPPICTDEARDGVLLRAVPVADRLASLADLAAQLSVVAVGGQIKFRLDP